MSRLIIYYSGFVSKIVTLEVLLKNISKFISGGSG